ncbi:MAG: hypothetical protein ACREHD_26965, partial [Pirellulales bacterium]
NVAALTASKRRRMRFRVCRIFGYTTPVSRLSTIFWWLLAAAMLWYRAELDLLFTAHPSMLFAAMGVMLVFVFRQAYRRELEKRRSQDEP